MFSISHSWLYKTNPSFLCLQLSAFTKHHLLVVMDYIFPPAVDIILPFQIGPRVYFWLSRDYSVSCYCCDIAKDHGFAVIMYHYAQCTYSHQSYIFGQTDLRTRVRYYHAGQNFIRKVPEPLFQISSNDESALVCRSTNPRCRR